MVRAREGGNGLDLFHNILEFCDISMSCVGKTGLMCCIQLFGLSGRASAPGLRVCETSPMLGVTLLFLVS